MKKIFLIMCLSMAFGSLLAQKEKQKTFTTTTNLSLEDIIQKIIYLDKHDEDYSIVSYNGKPTYTLDSLHQNPMRIKLMVNNQDLSFYGIISMYPILKIELSYDYIDKNIPTPPVPLFKSTPVDVIWEIIVEKQKDTNQNTIQIVYDSITKETFMKVKDMVQKEPLIDPHFKLVVDAKNISSELVFEKNLAEMITESAEIEMIEIQD